MTQIKRKKTKVVSISLPKGTLAMLDANRRKRYQTRSSFIASLIEKENDEERWRLIYEEGRRLGKKLKITSEDDVDRILHEAS
jgi:metal-responsive CopG/Arc/MetJ family transcriptional regulator